MKPEGRPEDLVAAWTVVCLLVLAAPFVLRWARRRRGRVALVAGNATVLVALVALLGVGLETWLRPGYAGTTWHAANNVTQAWFERHWRVNDEGFRDEQWPDAPGPREDRVGFLGDSFTAGYGVIDPEDRFPDLVRARLRQQTGRPLDVRNLGSIGAGTQRTLDLVRDALPAWNPRRLILQYALNDVEYLLPPETRDGASLPAAEPGSLVRRSYLLDLVRAQWLLARTGHGATYHAQLDAIHKDDTLWREHETNLRTMASLCRRNSTRLEVVVFPLLAEWGDAYPYAAWHARVRETFERMGVPVLDLSEAFAGTPGSELVVSVFDAHPNELAHRLAADAVWEAYFASGH